MSLFVLIAVLFAVTLHDRRGITVERKERAVCFGLPCSLFILLINLIANVYTHR